MPSTNVPEILESDIQNYIDSESDFAFEIRVVKELKKYGNVLHGGTYMDQVTGKPRQFDARMTMFDTNRVIRLAVECKNLRTSYPALILCVPRTVDEAFQDVLVSVDLRARTFGDVNRSLGGASLQADRAKVVKLPSYEGLYLTNHPVGKSITQVGKDKHGNFISGDAEVYGKWSQALSSADELVALCADDGIQSPSSCRFSCVVPVLVVPDGTLWRCVFDADGGVETSPEKVDRVHFYVGKECEFPRNKNQHTGVYRISHLEIVTVSGIQKLIDDLTSRPFLIPPERAQSLISKMTPGFGF